MKVSILLNTIDRYELTQQCVGHALDHTGYDDWELLVCDNGSQDNRTIEYIESLHPVYFRKNGQNQGNYQMLNQLLLRANGDAFCVIDNDIMLPNQWLGQLVDYNQGIPQSGVSGIQCVVKNGVPMQINGIEVWGVNGAIFGTKFFSRYLLDTIGYFCEDYGFYGLGDSDFGMRAKFAGFANYYLPDMKSQHLGVDEHDAGRYRQMKDKQMKQSRGKLGINLQRYKAGDYYVSPPEPM